MLLGFKSASGAPVTLKRLDGMIQCALNLRMKLLMFKFFTSYPLRSSHQ
jgi:hypothetical protein